MNHLEFDRLLCLHCAPVLLGCKPANLIAVEQEPGEMLEPFLDGYRCMLASNHVKIRMLCRGAHRCQLLFYRPELLQQVLRQDAVQELLIRAGYPAGAPLDCCLDLLSERMSAGESFPHEIGLFLGYPPADVTGFQENAGRNYILCRYWKVYAHPEEASRSFDRYDRCRYYMCSHLSAGFTLSQILETSYCA